MPGRPDPALIEADYVVDALRHAIDDGQSGLAGVPEAVRTLVRTGGWRERVIVRTGELVRFDTFEAFVKTPPLEGLGSSIAQLEALCEKDPEAKAAIVEALGQRRGRPRKGDIVTPFPKGNSEQAAIRRLRKDRPDIYQRYLGGELSAHAGMVEAGFRPRTLTVPADPSLAARRLWRHFTPDQRETFLAAFRP